MFYELIVLHVIKEKSTHLPVASTFTVSLVVTHAVLTVRTYTLVSIMAEGSSESIEYEELTKIKKFKEEGINYTLVLMYFVKEKRKNGLFTVILINQMIKKITALCFYKYIYSFL